MSIPDLSKLTIPRGDNRGLNPSRRRFSFKLITISAIVLVALLYALSSFFMVRTAEVELATVTTTYPSQEYTLLNATGYVVAQRKAAVASKATGRLEWLGVTEGSVVKEGEVIARLESNDVKATLQQSAANVTATRARLQEAYAQLNAAKAGEAQAKAELKDAEAALARANSLANKGFISPSATDAALARRDKALAALASSEAGSGSAKAGIANAQATIAAASAAQQGSAVAVEYTLIRAPFDGVVLSKSANVGDVVTPFSSALDAKGAVVTMADMSTLEVEADVSESSLYKVKAGQPCEIQLDALPDVRLQGEVSRIVPTVDRSKATILVKVRFTEPDSRVLPEMSAKVAFLSKSVPVERQKPVLAIRSDALVKRNGEQVAFVVRDGVAHMTKVNTAARLGDLLEVHSGVAAGDRVVVKPPEKLRSGDKIKSAES